MAILRWTPFRELSTVQERVIKLFDDVIKSPCRSDEGKEEVKPRQISIAVGKT